MKIAFVKPPVGGILGLEMLTFVEPLGPICVAACLEAEGHECKVFDLRIDGEEHGLDLCKRFAPDVVGLQCNFTTERNRTVRLAQRIKRENPGVFVVVGGHDASRDPNWFHHEVIDAVAVGDGEEVMPPMVDAIQRGHDLATIPGLMLHRDGRWISTGHAPTRKNLDDYPLPARHLIEHYADHYYINFHKPLALMETARGCPFKCNFCSVWKFHESTFREKSPERVVRELQAIKAEAIFITDDIFWMNVKRGRELGKAIAKSGIRKHFTIQTRSDIICKFPDVVEQWKECGRMTVFLGLEKIDDAGLKSVNKRNTADHNNQAIRILQDLGIGYTPNFIIDPTWDRSDFEKLKHWVDETGAYNSGFSVLTPLPGTDLWDSTVDTVVTRDWELFDIAHTVLPTKLPLEEFYREYAGLWKHAMDVRYEREGKLKTHLGLLAAIVTRRVTLTAIRKGMRMGSVLSDPASFLRAHGESKERLAEAESLAM